MTVVVRHMTSMSVYYAQSVYPIVIKAADARYMTIMYVYQTLTIYSLIIIAVNV